MLQLTYHTFGSDELQALCEGDQPSGAGPPRELHSRDSEAVRFLKGGVLYVHLIKAIGMISKPKYKGGFMTTRVYAPLVPCFFKAAVCMIRRCETSCIH